MTDNTLQHINVQNSQVGVIGNGAHVEGGIHFYGQSRPIPLQRPPRVNHFTGRQDVLSQLLADLCPGEVVTLCGPGGIGKSALAAAAIWALAPADEPSALFPDGIVFYSFYGKPETDKALDAIAEAYGESSRSGSAATVRRILSDRQMLLVLDGADEADNLGAVLELRGRKCGVLITSRKFQDAPSDPRHLDSLSQNDAVTLLRAWAVYDIDHNTAIQICQLVGCLPLAVSLIGRYLHLYQGEADYLKWLEKTPLEALDHGTRRSQSVPVLLKKSLDQIGKSARQVLAIVGCLALTPFDHEPILKALNLPSAQVHKALNSLVNFGLLTHDDEMYRISHALVHTFVREKEQPQSTALLRLATYYAKASSDQTKQSSDYSWQDHSRPHILSVLDCCIVRKRWKEVQDLAFAIDDYLEKRGHWTDRIKSLEMGKKASSELGDRRSEASFWGMLGRTWRALGQAQKALNFYDHALDLAREINDRREEGHWLGHKASAYRSLGKYKDALSLYQKALDIARAVGDRKREGVESGRLGLCYQLQGEPEKAISEHEKALQIAREPPSDRRQESVQLGFLGRAYRSLGQIGNAFECHQKALEIAQQAGHRQEESVQLGCLGLVRRAQGKIEQALDDHRKALQIAHEIGNRWEEEYNLGHLGNVYRDLGEYDAAIKHYIDSLEQAIEINDFRGEGIRLSGLGTICHILGWSEKAIQCQQETKLIVDILNDRLGQSYVLLHLGSMELAVGHLDTARELCRQSCDLDRPETGYQAALMLGIISLHQQTRMAGKTHRFVDAKARFEDCVQRCQALLDKTPDLYQAQYVLATALVGQSVCKADNTHQDVPIESLARSAMECYKKVIEICSAAGVIHDVMNKLELIRQAGVEGLEPFFSLLEDKVHLERAIQLPESTRDFVRKVLSRGNQVFRRWRLGLHLQENDPGKAEQLLLEYVNYLRENNISELKAAVEYVAYVHETIPPGSSSVDDCHSYLCRIGHPNPDEGVKGVIRMKARNHLEQALGMLEEIRSPRAAQVRKLLVALEDES